MEQLQKVPERYPEIKENIRIKLNETADNFIVIGYYLKLVRDNMLYKIDKYSSMAEFAQSEYGISQSTASRFMDINTKFSKDGNSKEISDQYRGYGASKLQEMLTLREEDMELVTPETTVRQIKEIKDAERAERQQEEEEAAQHLPIVEMARGEEETKEAHATSQESEIPPIEQTVRALLEAKPIEWCSRVINGFFTDKELAEQLSPSGSRTFNHGVYMLFLYKYEIGAKLRYYKDGKAQVESYTYAELLAMMQRLGHDIVFAHMNPPAEPTPEEAAQEEPAQEVPKAKTWVTPEVLEHPAGQQEGYEPLPGQTVLNEQGEVEESGTGEPESATVEPESEPRQQGYAEIEISNAKGYFEMEIERMTNMGGATRDSVRCRNYKIALEAIRGYFNI